MIDNNHFLFWKVHCHFCNLLFCQLLRVFFKLTGHFEYTDFSDMIIIIERIFSCVHFVLFSFNKCDALGNQSIIPIRIQLNSFFSNFLNSLYQAIWVSIRIIFDDSHSSINLNDLFPMWHFSRTIILNSFKFVWIAIFFL